MLINTAILHLSTAVFSTMLKYNVVTDMTYSACSHSCEGYMADWYATHNRPEVVCALYGLISL